MKRSTVKSSSLSVVFAAVLAIASVTACGTREPEPASDHSSLYSGYTGGTDRDDTIQKIPVDDRTSALKIVDEANVYCEETAGCSPSVGMLVSIQKTSVGMCTAFLISDDVAVTNSHCLPTGLTAGKSCDEDVWVLFPGTGGYASAKVGCQKVLADSGNDPKTLGPDYAVLRLDRHVDRPTLKISHDGMADGEKVTLLRVTPQSDTQAWGALGKLECRVTQNSMIVPSFDNPSNPLGVLADCNVKHGNSGSPIMMPDGRIGGVIQALVDVNALHLDSLLDSWVRPLNVATNFACVRLPGEPADARSSEPTPAACKRTASEGQKSQETAFGSKLKNTFDERMDAWRSKHRDMRAISEVVRLKETMTLRSKSPFARFEASGDGTAVDTFFVPECLVKAPPPKRSSKSFDLPVWRDKVGVDSYLRLEARLNGSSESFAAKITVDGTSFEASQKAHVTLELSKKDATTLFDADLGICP